jgi:hypothetical protein
MLTFTTFDGPGGSPTTVNGINNSGDAVGFTTNAMVNSNFVRKHDGTFSSVDVGDPAGSANAVNTSLEIVGAANGSAFSLVNGGSPAMLSPFGATESAAFGINDSGAIVGQYTAADGTHMPGFVDEGGTFGMIVPTAASVATFVQGINTTGIAVGFYTEDGTTQHGFKYDTATKATTLLADPVTSKTMGNNLVLTQFLGVNDSAHAVGYYQTKDGSQYGFLCDLGTMTYTFVDAPMAAPVNGVQITQITGIDNAGEIAGFFIDATGGQHGFIATPSP